MVEYRHGKVTFFEKMEHFLFSSALALKPSGGWRLKLYSIKAPSILIESHPSLFVLTYGKVVIIFSSNPYNA